MARRRNPLADAHEEIRKLKNKIHAIEHPLKVEIERLKENLQAVIKKSVEDNQKMVAYREAFEGVIPVVQVLLLDSVKKGRL